MADIVFVAVLIAFFALAALFVTACDRIIGADHEVSVTADEAGDDAAAERLAA